jgi:hypothetical protein
MVLIEMGAGRGKRVLPALHPPPPSPRPSHLNFTPDVASRATHIANEPMLTPDAAEYPS